MILCFPVRMCLCRRRREQRQHWENYEGIMKLKCVSCSVGSRGCRWYIVLLLWIHYNTPSTLKDKTEFFINSTDIHRSWSKTNLTSWKHVTCFHRLKMWMKLVMHISTGRQCGGSWNHIETKNYNLKILLNLMATMNSSNSEKKRFFVFGVWLNNMKKWKE